MKRDETRTREEVDLSEMGVTAFKFPVTAKVSHLRFIVTVERARARLRSAPLPLYFKEIQILSDMEVRESSKWSLEASGGRVVVVGLAHWKKKLTRLNCGANRISAFL